MHIYAHLYIVNLLTPCKDATSDHENPSEERQYNLSCDFKARPLPGETLVTES